MFQEVAVPAWWKGAEMAPATASMKDYLWRRTAAGGERFEPSVDMHNFIARALGKEGDNDDHFASELKQRLAEVDPDRVATVTAQIVEVDARSNVPHKLVDQALHASECGGDLGRW